MGDKKNYKIKLANGRIIGPVSIDQIIQFIRKGHISGTELTQVQNAKNWKPFSSYPELAELILNSLEKKPEPIVKDEDVTLTETLHSEQIQSEMNIEPDNEIPTLLDIKAPTSPDEEKTFIDLKAPEELGQENENSKTEFVAPDDQDTALVNINENSKTIKVNSPAVIHRDPDDADATKMISARALMPIEEKAPPPKSFDTKILPKSIEDDEQEKEPPKKRLLSKKVFLVITGLLLLGVFLSQYEPPDKETIVDELGTMFPTFKKYPLPPVSAPLKTSEKIDPVKSQIILEKGIKYYIRHNPLDYRKAIIQFTRSLRSNPKNMVSRAMLARAYLDLANVIPKDDQYYDAVTKLLGSRLSDTSLKLPPEYIVAKAQFYMMLKQDSQARKILASRIRRNPSSELYYFYALSFYNEGNNKKALTYLTKALGLKFFGRHDPKHLLLRALILSKTGQIPRARKELEKITKEYPRFGEAYLHYSELLIQNPRNEKDVIKGLLVGKLILKRPRLLDKIQLANLFIAIARGLVKIKKYKQAANFALYVRRLDPNNQLGEIVFYRILTKSKKRHQTYDFILQGKQKEKLSQFKAAENFYYRARSRAPNDATPLILLGKLNMNEGKYKSAINKFSRAIQIASRSRKLSKVHKFFAYYNLALAYINTYDVKEAKVVIDRAEELRKRSRLIPKFYIAYLRGLLAFKETRLEQGVTYLKQSLAYGNTLPKVYVMLGQYTLDESIKTDDPKLSDAQKTFKSPKYGLAEFYFNNALRHSPFDADSLLGIAISRFYRDSPSLAVEFLKERLRKYPKSPEILTSLALVYFRSGDKISGDSHILQVIRNNSNYAFAYKLFGDEARKEGDRQIDFNEKKKRYVNAIQAYKAYTKFRPYNPEGYLAMGELYFFLRDYGSAAKNYLRVLKLSAKHPKVRLRLAKIALNGGDKTKAKAYVEKEIELFPDSQEAHFELGKIRLAQNEIALAAQSFAMATRLDANNFEAIKHLAYTHHLRKNYEDALALYQRALKIDQLNAELHLRIAQTYDKMGNVDKAIQGYKNYIGLINDREEIRRYQKRIKTLKPD